MAYKGRSSQAIANSYPLWSNIRTDEQSLGRQLINPIGLSYDDLRSQLERIRDNQFLPTSIVSDIDIIYPVSLGRNFLFTKELTDLTDLPYTPPVVSGLRNGSYKLITAEEDNTVEGFWYDAAPSEISIGTANTGPHVVASGIVSESPFTLLTVSGLCHIPNRLTVRLTDGTTYTTLMSNNLTKKSILQIHGLTRQDQEVTEELVFLYDETQKTLNEFKYIYEDGIRISGPDPETTKVVVLSADFNGADYKINYNLDVSVDDFESPLFWAIGSGVNATLSTLDLKAYINNEFSLKVEGFTDKETILQQELLDLSGNTIRITGLAVEPNSNNIWITDTNNLYLFSSLLPAAATELLDQKQYDAEAVIQPNTYWTLVGDSIELDYLWVRPSKGMIAHRAYVTKPDGTKKSLENGAEVTYHTDTSSWAIYEPNGRAMRATEIYTLDQRGSYVYTLEAKYTDYTTSIDQRVVTVLSQTARAQFSLSSLGLVGACGIDIDSENKIWILDSAGRKWPVTLYYDNMLIDFDNKIIYLREKYDLVRVY